EECYFIFSYSPIREEGGGVGGVLVTVTETTARVIGERRLKTTQALAAETRDARTVSEACEIAGRVLARNAADLPFARIYVLDQDGARATLVATTGTAPEDFGSELALDAHVLVEALAARDVPDGGVAPQGGRTLAIPIAQPGAAHPMGLLVAGTSPRLILDEAYQDFLSLVGTQIGTAIAAAQAFEEARARAEALAALDRAKTAFFSNVSHEFRTPLTLMLGPTEDALATPDGALRGADLETVHRNELRLLKLVNMLLDFSRIEAGRVTARFEPTDIASLTADLASAFRSAMERAGLRLDVHCPPLPDPVYVDREMWEKIVLNLLSNAFKFTFTGTISVEVALREDAVELCVRDTGVGIAEGEIGRVFDRFHRVERSKARTQEGSGIGLALVKELVALHAGTIAVTSVPGEGSTFCVRLPLGHAHLPSDQVISAEPRAKSSVTAVPYVEEALRWLSDAPAAGAAARPPAEPLARVLVADDNADMRDYMMRLLSPRFEVDVVPDGAAALASIAHRRPDVIVSDVMMPGLDGFQLIAAIRADERARTVPVILLSARAGEEAGIEGLHAGADDYLVKPFSARELIARIDAQLVRARLRSIEEAHAVRLAAVFANAPVGVAILRGPDHVYEFANREYLDLVAHRDVVGRPIREALPELAGQGIFELLDRVYETGEPLVGRSIRAVIQRRGSVPEETFFDLVYQPLFDNGSGVTGIAVVAFDVTELTRARREAEAANRAKDEFLAMLGHELRNPLAPILTALQLMRLRGIVGAERERTIIERQVRHVVALVDDLLDISRITRGKVQLKKEPRELAEIVNKAIEMTSPAIENQRHRLVVSVPRGLVVTADASRLAQVVANLLTNAAKYTNPGGEISVTGAVEGAVALLRVEDSGRGISPEMLPRIFDLFSQERQEIDRSEGGLGLGLAIVKTLVHAHGGSVEAHSAGKGRGAQFTIRLPLEPGAEPVHVETAPSVLTAAAPLDPLRILIVDDNPDAAELLAEVLSAVGYQTLVALDGPSALEVAADFEPAVALLDIGLPVMDGFELAERLRAIPGLSGIKLVAITGYGLEVDRRRTRDAGFDEHLVKPVDLERLQGWLRAARDVDATG
ncbi:MAG TPA: ATP-binding protein, partial [Vicinamibacterales bacterium]